jgi:6-pyruvoyl-tetrahydropterin synthase
MKLVSQLGGSLRALELETDSSESHLSRTNMSRTNMSKTNMSKTNMSTLEWRDKNNNSFIHIGPDISLYQVDIAHLDPLFLAQHLKTMLLNKWQSPQIQDIDISFREEAQEEAFFQYSHGLRLHEGACQRIAHGHRSKIRVFTKQGYDFRLSQVLAARINHGYFLDSGNLQPKKGKSNISQQDTDEQVTLSYQAPEGFYQLTLPRHRCIIMNTETTVENIAAYLLHHAREHISADICTIQVYEGWLKGAFARLK